MNYDEACLSAKNESIKHNCVQHVLRYKDGIYYVSDWYDCDTVVVTYESGIKLN